MTIEFQAAAPEQTAEYVHLRGQTRENAVSAARLQSLGITAQTWAADIRTNTLLGFDCRVDDALAGYCFGNTHSGEVVVLVVGPAFEGLGIGQRLLALVVEQLRGLGHSRLFLGCAADPLVRSYGFYRHLGWRSTGSVDKLGDEVLELP